MGSCAHEERWAYWWERERHCVKCRAEEAEADRDDATARAVLSEGRCDRAEAALAAQENRNIKMLVEVGLAAGRAHKAEAALADQKFDGYRKLGARLCVAVQRAEKAESALAAIETAVVTAVARPENLVEAVRLAFAEARRAALNEALAQAAITEAIAQNSNEFLRGVRFVGELIRDLAAKGTP